jgi:4-hydroxythreonine-4-phosphate dehydrogenase
VTTRHPGPPVLGITLGDPRGIGPEVVDAALVAGAGAGRARFVLIGPEGLARVSGADRVDSWAVEFDGIGTWTGSGRTEAGQLSAAAIERGIELALSGRVDGLVTAPISKEAISAAGYPFPGHTEFLRDRTGVPDVTLVMAAERTPLGGPLRLALATVHVPLRSVPDLITEELLIRRATIAARGLRDWWGIDRPRLAFAGLNPHASEGGLFGNEEERVFRPAIQRLVDEDEVEATGPFPADTVFRRCIAGEVDLVVVPYHDVGLAVLKTLAPEAGVNVTTGLPFPRTSPDHGTAFDIAGRGIADPRSMAAAIEACIDFCERHHGLTESA